MPLYAKIFLLWLLVLSLLAFVLCGWDKSRARKHRRRIPEKTLFLLSFLGGGPGFLIGMGVVRHKTRHLSFRILIPLSVLLWVLIGLLLFWGQIPC